MVPIVDDRNNQSVDISELYDVENELPEDDDLDGTQHMMSQSHAVVSATKELSKTSYRGPSRGYASGSRKSANSTSLGHASTPVLTLNDLESVVGPSKLSTMSKASYQRAKAHQHNMSLKKAAKNQRRSEVKNSLSMFLNKHGVDDESDEEDEADSLISDEDQHVNGTEADNRSIGSGIRRRRRISDEGSVGSRSMTSRKRAPRRRLKGDSDDATITSVGSRSRRRSRLVRDVADDVSVGSVGRRRRQGESQKPEGSVRRRRRTIKAAGEDEKPASKDVREHQTNLKPEEDRSKRKGTPRSRLRKKAESGDDKSHHRRTRKSEELKKMNERLAKPDETKMKDKQSRHIEEAAGVPPPPPSQPPPDLDDDVDDQVEESEHKDKVNSLATHLEANVKVKDERGAEDASEESSRFSFGYSNPTHTLLQFDPTNVDNVMRVRQDEANMTSETIKHADGTESELQIRDLDGLLPRFENHNDSNASGFSLNPKEIEDGSDGSVSISISSDDENPADDEEANDEAPVSARSQDNGNDAIVDRSEPKRGLKKSRSAKLRGLFSRRKKKGKEKTDDDEESSGDDSKSSKSRFGRKKKRDKRMAHALMNDDSDASN